MRPFVRDGGPSASAGSGLPSAGAIGGDRAQQLAVAIDERDGVGGELRSRRSCRPASRCGRSRNRSARACPRLPCGRRGRARRRCSARSTRPCRRRRRRSARSVLRRPGTRRRGATMPSRSMRTGAAAPLRLLRRRAVAGSFLRTLRLGADAARLGIERRRAAGLQRDQVRPRAAREAEVEADVVVDRIEGAHRDEVEIAPLGIERRRRVAELGLGEPGARLRRGRVQLQRDVARVGGEGVGEPGAVG